VGAGVLARYAMDRGTLSRMTTRVWVHAVALAALVGCDSGPSAQAPAESRVCTSITGALPGEVEFAGCPDGTPRTLSCKRQADEADAEIFCACMRRGTMGASFMLFSDTVDAAADPARAVQIGNRRCGWDLEEPRS
jgi:hypothetical protein